MPVQDVPETDVHNYGIVKPKGTDVDPNLFYM